MAEITYRSVEDVLASTVDAALPLDPNLPSDVADDVAAMALMNDDALIAAAESSLSLAQQRRLQKLTEFGGQRRLSTSEEAELAHLLELYNRSVLRRAKELIRQAFPDGPPRLLNPFTGGGATGLEALRLGTVRQSASASC